MSYYAPAMRRTLVIATLLGVALGSSAIADRARHRKPAAPVTLTATARQDARGWRIVVDAVATREVTSLELSLPGGAPARFARTAVGVHRRSEFPVRLVGAGMDVVAAARVTGAFGTRTAAVVVRVGAPAAAVRSREPTTVHTRDGRDIAETREAAP